MSKESVFTMKLERDLRARFMAEAQALDRPASQIVREFMREFVERQQAARAHDRWFRDEVQKALDDPRSGIPHDNALAQTRAIIERIAAESE